MKKKPFPEVSLIFKERVTSHEVYEFPTFFKKTERIPQPIFSPGSGPLNP